MTQIALFCEILLIQPISMRNRFHFSEKSSSIHRLGANLPGFLTEVVPQLARYVHALVERGVVLL